MDLWIRTKNKKNLIRVNEIYLDDVYFKDGSVCIMGNKFILGKYKEKRAIEIIDEISNLLNPILLFQNTEVDEKTLNEIKKVGAVVCNGNSRVETINTTVVYQMPEK